MTEPKGVTDEEILRAYIQTKSLHKAAKELPISAQALQFRTARMRLYGVQVPWLKPIEGIPPWRVEELNEFIKKTQEANARQVS